MSFNLKNVGGFGYSDNFDLEISDGVMTKLNSYAAISAIERNLITLDLENAYRGKFEFFTAGTEILIHASASPSLLSDKLGNYIVAKILVADGAKLTLDKNVEDVFKNSDLLDYYIQAVTFAGIHCLKILKGGIISPPNFSPFNYYGGIVAIKCDYALEFHGGYISLTDCGIPINWKDKIRPLTAIELSGELDIDETAGKENFQTKDKFLLNAGDGAAFIIAKKISVIDKSSRVGNFSTHGKKFCRGASDSIFKPSNVTNVGGSTLLFACRDFENFDENLIAKYRTMPETLATKGKGLARCYIASEELLPYEGDKLYSADFTSNKSFFSAKLNLYNFGSGRFGDIENPIYPLNNVADILYKYKNKILIREKNLNGLATFDAGSKIISFGKNLNSIDFCFAEIISHEANCLTLDRDLPETFDKIISVAECENFTLEQDFDDEIFAVLVRNNCKISGRINYNCIIGAKNLILSGSPKLGNYLFLNADSITGFNENFVPAAKSFIFTNTKFD